MLSKLSLWWKNRLEAEVTKHPVFVSKVAELEGVLKVWREYAKWLEEKVNKAA